MRNVNFLPYIGKSYHKGFENKKLLILGESHYFNGKEESEMVTNQVVTRYLNYLKNLQPHENWMRTFTRFAKSFKNGDMNREKEIDFWERVSFYNYVQTPMFTAREAPTKKQFDDSESAFLEVLEELKPDYIIAWGLRLWNSILSKDQENGRFFYQLKNGKKVFITYVIHPSATQYSYSKAFDELSKIFL